MKKPYVELNDLEVMFVEDIICTSGNFYENEQPDFDYFDQAWKEGN